MVIRNGARSQEYRNHWMTLQGKTFLTVYILTIGNGSRNAGRRLLTTLRDFHSKRDGEIGIPTDGQWESLSLKFSAMR